MARPTPRRRWQPGRNDDALRKYRLPKATHPPNFDDATGRSHWTFVYNEAGTLTKATYSDPPPARVPGLS